MNTDGLRGCAKTCLKLKEACPVKDCRLWIDYPDENNCTLVSIYINGNMTLRQIAERSGISFAMVKQIETKALEKMKKLKTFNCFRF